MAPAFWTLMLESGGSVQACLVHLLSHWEVRAGGWGWGRVHPSIPARRSLGLGTRRLEDLLWGGGGPSFG